MLHQPSTNISAPAKALWLILVTRVDIAYDADLNMYYSLLIGENTQLNNRFMINYDKRSMFILHL